jgi:hypothetical protein
LIFIIFSILLCLKAAQIYNIHTLLFDYKAFYFELWQTFEQLIFCEIKLIHNKMNLLIPYKINYS